MTHDVSCVFAHRTQLLCAVLPDRCDEYGRYTKEDRVTDMTPLETYNPPPPPP